MKNLISKTTISALLLSMSSIYAQNYYSLENRENALEKKYVEVFKSEKVSEYSIKEIADFTIDSRDLLSEYIDYLNERFNQKDKILLPYEIVIFEDILETYLKAVKLIKEQEGLSNEELRKLSLQVLKLETFRPLYEQIYFNKQIRRVTSDFENSPKSQVSDISEIKDSIINKKFVASVENKIKSLQINNENVYSNFLETSAIVKSVKQGNSIKDLAKKKTFWKKLSDGTSNVMTAITSGLSAGFGALAGNISWRDGHLGDNEQLLNELKSELKPFDILLEKKRYKLTDYTIPGYWGHAGVYVGSKEQLIKEGLWNDKSIRPYHDLIEAGKVIFQVRRSGLVWNTLKEFIDLDEMGIIRIKDFEAEKVNKSTLLAKLMEQVGKNYDYSFNTYTTSKITCTEIVAFSYGRINWPTESLLGRKTFTPNHLTSLLFYNDSPIELIKYVSSDKKGNRVDLNLEDLGKTVSYVRNPNKSDSFLLKGEKCKREVYSRVRGKKKFRYSCEDTFTESTYIRN